MGAETALSNRAEAGHSVDIQTTQRHPAPSILQRLARNKLVYLFGSVLALASCGDKEDDSDARRGNSGIASISSALTSGSAEELGEPQLAAGTSPGDGPQNFGQIGGDTVRVFERDGSLWYQSCSTGSEVDCFTSSPQEIADLPDTGGVGFQSAGVFEDVDGSPMLLVSLNTSGQPLYYVPISYSGGTITVTGDPSSSHLSNALNAASESMSIFYDAGVPYVVSFGGSSTQTMNLHTGDVESIDLDPDEFDDCGLPHVMEDGAALTSRPDGGGDCEVGVATSLEDAQTSSEITELDSDTNDALGTQPRDPRSAGDVLTVTSDEGHYYAVTGGGGEEDPDTGTEDPVDTDNDGISDGSDNCPDDSNPMQDDLDGDGEGDVCDTDRDGDGIDNEDDNCPDTENPDQNDPDGDGVGEACDDDETMSPQEAFEQACEFAADRVRIFENNCWVHENNEFVDGGCENPMVVLEGTCTVEVDLGNPNPLVMEIDGVYGFNLQDDFGARFSGNIRVLDRGNEFGTVVDGIGLGPVGTIYEVQEMTPKSDGSTMIHVMVPEGKVIVTDNETGEVLVTLDAGEYADIDTDNAQIISTDGQLPTPDNSGGNGGGNGGGCSTPGSSPNSGIPAQALVLAILALIGLPRRRERKD